MNIRNLNKDTEKWARETLRAYTDAMNLPPNLPDSDMMLNIPIMCKVGIKKSEGYDPRNVIRTIRPMGFNPNAQPGQQVQGGMQAPQMGMQRPTAPQMPAGFGMAQTQQGYQQQPQGMAQPVYQQQPQYGAQTGFQQPQQQQMAQGYGAQQQSQQMAPQAQQQGFSQPAQQFTQAQQQWEQPALQQQPQVQVEQPVFQGFQASQQVPQTQVEANGFGGATGGNDEQAPWN